MKPPRFTEQAINNKLQQNVTRIWDKWENNKRLRNKVEYKSGSRDGLHFFTDKAQPIAAVAEC